MKKLIVLIWLFVAYLFIASDARSEDFEVDEADIYEFCFKVDFVNFRYCVRYVKECVLDEGVKEIEFCKDDYKANIQWSKNE